MAEERPVAPPGSERRLPLCRWRTSAETLDLIEALERIEATVMRLDERLRKAEERQRQTGAASE